MVIPWTHTSQPPNGISIGLAAFAGLRAWPTDKQTHRHTQRPTTLLRL